MISGHERAKLPAVPTRNSKSPKFQTEILPESAVKSGADHLVEFGAVHLSEAGREQLNEFAVVAQPSALDRVTEPEQKVGVAEVAALEQHHEAALGQRHAGNFVPLLEQ